MKPTDIYTKAVLTVIAVALCAIAFQNVILPAQAASHCGENSWNPCYVEVENWPSSQDVWVENWP